MTDWQWLIIDVLQSLAAGLLVGGIYGLMCVGLGIIFGIMRVVNFAHGDFMMLGMYVAYYLVTGFGVLAFLGPYAAPIVGAVLAGPVVFVIGTLLHRTLIARVTGARVVSAEAEGHYAQIILTLGIALVLANGGLILFGSQPVSVQTPLSRWNPLARDRQRSCSIRRAPSASRSRSPSPWALRVPDAHAVWAGRCVPPPIIRSPRPMSASTWTAPTARLRARRGHYGGGRRARSPPTQSFQPYVGFDFVIIMYAGVVLGGMGSILGAFWGGLTIGVVQQLSTLVLPYQLQNAAIFVVFLLIIFFGRRACSAVSWSARDGRAPIRPAQGYIADRRLRRGLRWLSASLVRNSLLPADA